MFAKMFQSEEVGQIVVMKDINDDQNPCIRIYYDPKIEDLSVCNIIISFDDEDARDRAFKKVELEHVEDRVKNTISMLSEAVERIYEHDSLLEDEDDN